MDYRETLPHGTVLDGKYRIERLLGAGGFGITYGAFDDRLAAPVAIKEYFPSQFGLRDSTYSVRPRSNGDRDIFERLRSSFLREARTLNQFDHPAIVRVLNVFEAYGTAYMVMKYETGPSLKNWLADLVRLPTQDELDRLSIPLLEALETIHRAAFLHRDIAPDNIIVRADGSPVLLDFGASRRVMGEMSGTLTGVVKKGYSPQEQYATDGRSQGPWTDIYALGATLYRCVSGETPAEATERMLDDRIVSAVEAGGDRYRPAFLAAIDAAMMLRPEERPQSIGEWRRILLDGVAQPGRPQPRSSASRSAVTVARPDAPRPRDAQTTPRSGNQSGIASAADAMPTQPRRKLAAAAIAAGVAAVIGGGLFAGSSQLGFPAASVQPPARIESGSTSSKSDDPRRQQDEQIERWAREAAARATEETRRQLAVEIEARRRAEDAHRQAIEDAGRRAVEEARLRQLADEAEARRRAGEEAQRLQQEEIARLTREAAARAEEKALQLNPSEDPRSREGGPAPSSRAVTDEQQPAPPVVRTPSRKNPVKKAERRPSQRSAASEQARPPVAKKKCEPFYADVRRTTDLCR